jgi:hypothetical protein
MKEDIDKIDDKIVKDSLKEYENNNIVTNEIDNNKTSQLRYEQNNDKS